MGTLLHCFFLISFRAVVDVKASGLSKENNLFSLFALSPLLSPFLSFLSDPIGGDPRLNQLFPDS